MKLPAHSAENLTKSMQGLWDAIHLQGSTREYLQTLPLVTTPAQ